MGHIPHVYTPPPWQDGPLPFGPELRHHLERVLRRGDTSEVSYTDGMGTIGVGTLAEGGIVRGAERQVTRPPSPSIAVAPTGSVERNRFIVEKCSELGVAGLQWLATRHGRSRPPRIEKAGVWAIAALQQSRGAHLMEIRQGECQVRELEGAVVVADPAGASAVELDLAGPVTIAIAPEGGFTADELPPRVRRWKLSERVLRTETAAVISAALACDLMQRSRSAGSASGAPGRA